MNSYTFSNAVSPSPKTYVPPFQDGVSSIYTVHPDSKSNDIQRLHLYFYRPPINLSLPPTQITRLTTQVPQYPSGV